MPMQLFMLVNSLEPQNAFAVLFAVWLSGKYIAIGSRNLWFDSLAGQIGRSVANGSSLLRRFFEFEVVLPRR